MTNKLNAEQLLSLATYNTLPAVVDGISAVEDTRKTGSPPYGEGTEDEEREAYFFWHNAGAVRLASLRRLVVNAAEQLRIVRDALEDLQAEAETDEEEAVLQPLIDALNKITAETP